MKLLFYFNIKIELSSAYKNRPGIIINPVNIERNILTGRLHALVHFINITFKSL